MDFGWSQEQRQLRESAIRFARAELDRDVADRDRQGRFPAEEWKRCAEFGVQGLPIPERFGGQGADLVTTTLVLEALGYGCRDNGLLFSLNAHLWSCALPVLRFGTPEQQARYLPPLCAGSLVGVQAVTETGSGSDALRVATTARAEGDRYVLSGSKVFITNAPVAGLFVVLTTVTTAGTGRQGSAAELSTFLVERDTPGLSVGEPVDKLGLHTSPMAEVVLDGCSVPATARLGGPGAGMAVFTTTIEWERSFILASAVGTMQRQLEEALSHARGHTRFGRPIGRNQAVAHRLVDMRVRWEASRWLLYHLAWLKDQGRRTPLESAMVKLFLSESLVQSSLSAMETFGGYGYMAGTTQERDVRDALASRIYSGTSDIQRNLIAGLLGL